jgi:hypothetical protein
LAVPTRFIEQPEFEELLRLEGGTITTYKLTAIPFDPPRPEHPAGLLTEKKLSSVRVLMLPVYEPRLYRDPSGVMSVVYPSFEYLTYEAASDIHPIKNEWCYRFTPYNWDEDSELGHAEFLFKDEALADYDKSDVLTH